MDYSPTLPPRRVEDGKKSRESPSRGRGSSGRLDLPPSHPRSRAAQGWRVQEASSEDPVQRPREPDTLGAADPPGSPAGMTPALVWHFSPSRGRWGQVQETVWQENLQGPFPKACSQAGLGGASGCAHTQVTRCPLPLGTASGPSPQ